VSAPTGLRAPEGTDLCADKPNRGAACSESRPAGSDSGSAFSSRAAPLATRNVALAQALVGLDGEIERLNRAIFNRAVDVGDDLEVREWAMFMILVARCLERIAGNTVDIAEQTVFVVTGLFREFAGESQPA